MNPVTVSIEVPSRREDVYEFLDVLANHEQFTNHMLVDWSTSGRLSGVGARARMRFKKPGRAEWVDMEVIDATRPREAPKRPSAQAADDGHAAPTRSPSCVTAER